MFLRLSRLRLLALSFPRIRGDVPARRRQEAESLRFSPHTRGCSVVHAVPARCLGVFPAYAGMFLKTANLNSVYVSFPRIRGDVPPAWDALEYAAKFSPHTRGCSCSSRHNQGPELRFPRIRGDVPVSESVRETIREFSPHTRGCSYWKPSPALNQTVFPAYAGMFRHTPMHEPVEVSFPRIRGDVPAGP